MVINTLFVFIVFALCGRECAGFDSEKNLEKIRFKNLDKIRLFFSHRSSANTLWFNFAFQRCCRAEIIVLASEKVVSQ